VETLGDYLKDKRETQNITVEEVAQATRIRKTILEALENNRFDLIPPKVFAQGFIKSYAAYLELDESEAIKRYAAAMDAIEAEKSPEEEVIPTQPQRNLPLRKILPVAIALVVLFNLWLLMRAPETTNDTPLKNTPETQSATPPQSPPVTQQDVLIEKGEGPSAPEEEIIAIVTDEKLPVNNEEIPAPKDEKPTIAEEEAITIPEERIREDSGEESLVSPSEEMALRVVASERVWMRIQLDQNKPYETLLRAGESYTVKAQNKFTIRIGNAGGVELFFNEKPLGNPGKPGEVVDLTLPE
jgi:cytoskeleton protein RodZ